MRRNLLALCVPVLTLVGCQSTSVPFVEADGQVIVDERTEAGRFADVADAIRIRDTVLVERMDVPMSVAGALGPAGREVLLTMSAGSGPTPGGLVALAVAAHREPGSPAVAEVPTLD